MKARKINKTVVAGLIQQDGRLLICQRSKKSSFAGKWEFPGGKIEAGESPRAALRRELSEELSIAAKVTKLRWRENYLYPGHTPLLLLFYVIQSYFGTPENKVFLDIRWVPIQDLLRYDFLSADLPLVAHLHSGEIILPNCFQRENAD